MQMMQILNRTKIKFLFTLQLFLLLFFFTLIETLAQTSNTWWVHATGLGSQSGADSLNATTVTQINNKNIQPGDFVYFIQGIYNTKFEPSKSGTAGNLITFMANPTNTDTVWFTGQSTSIIIENDNYLRFLRLGFKNVDRGIQINDPSNVIYLDSIITRKSVSYAINLSGNNAAGDPTVIDSIWIRWCDIKVDSIIDAQTDGIFVQYATNIFIISNKIEMLNTLGSGHNDCIQTTNHLGNYTIANNVLYNTKATDSQIMMLNNADGADNYRVIIYNNVMYGIPRPTISFNISTDLTHLQPADIFWYNNTIYNIGTGTYPYSYWDTTCYFKNNIVVTANYPYTTVIGKTSYPQRSNYNYFEGSSYYAPVLTGSTSITWANWQAQGGDVNSIIRQPYNNEVMFEKPEDFDDLRLQKTSPAINAGTNLQNEVESWRIDGVGWTGISNPYITGANGTVRDASPDIGAYEYSGGGVITDTTPPNLLSASVINPTTIDLTFSEALESSSALTKTNYTINNGIVVNSTALSADAKRVTLTTTEHTANQTYTIVVNNVKDLAGNIISSNNSVQYSFIENTVGNLKADVKIFLQGPFQSNIMITELSNNAFIPSQQPYNIAPWNYSGNESLPAGQAGLSVDWILVELRSAQNPGQVISRRAGLLRNDGRIMEPDGILGVTFNDVLYGSYYIAVHHRNHLAVMTSAPVLFSPDNSLYDFTNSLTSAYGQNAMAEITAGVFGMFAGDGNGDGGITISDHNDIWLPQNGSFGYLKGDFNLDCGVTIHDVNLYWNPNNGSMSQVP